MLAPLSFQARSHDFSCGKVKNGRAISERGNFYNNIYIHKNGL